MWWLAPTAALLMLPVGIPALLVLRYMGWDGYARAAQGLMLLSVVSGPFVGFIILWSVGNAGLDSSSLRRAQWLARFAVVVPFITLCMIFWMAGKL